MHLLNFSQETTRVLSAAFYLTVNPHALTSTLTCALAKYDTLRIDFSSVCLVVLLACVAGAKMGGKRGIASAVPPSSALPNSPSPSPYSVSYARYFMFNVLKVFNELVIRALACVKSKNVTLSGSFFVLGTLPWGADEDYPSQAQLRASLGSPYRDLKKIKIKKKEIKKQTNKQTSKGN